MSDEFGDSRYAYLNNDDLNPGDIVRYEGKEWFVQGIDDNDLNLGLLLLDMAEAEYVVDYVDSTFPVTRGSNRRPASGCGDRWGWASSKDVELVSRAKDVEPASRGEEQASHTYIVTLKTKATIGEDGSLCDATVLVYDDEWPAVFSSEERAEEYADKMRRLFPKEKYEVIKLR